MRLRQDLELMLMHWKLGEYAELPFYQNYLSFKEDSGYLSMWGYLRFLNWSLKRYKKERCLQSYAEYLDEHFPPIEIMEDLGTED